MDYSSGVTPVRNVIADMTSADKTAAISVSRNRSAPVESHPEADKNAAMVANDSEEPSRIMNSMGILR